MPASRPTGRRPRGPVIIVVLVAAVVVLGAGGAAYMLGGTAPAAVSLATAAPTSSAPAATPVLAASTATASPAGSSPRPTGFDGTWSVDTSVGSFSDFSSSFVGYRVAENLANVGSTTAVGRTPKVSGSVTLAGSTITAAMITADLTALQSDKPMRDGQLHRQALETDQFPTATFELAKPIQLPTAPADGATWSVTAIGRLTLHGVTRDVSIPLQATLSGDVATVVGSVGIAFADYGIAAPQSMVVLSVADHGTLELQLHLRRA